MIKIIDDFLNNITMYRLTLYGLGLLAVLSIVFGFLNILPYPGFLLMFSLFYILVVCWLSNIFFSEAFGVPTNRESVYITSLILFLIITPPSNVYQLTVLYWAGILAIASKFIFVINKKHIFNPVAISLFILGITINYGVSWWIGNPVMFPALFVVGLLIVRKIRRFHLVAAFFCVALLTISIFTIRSGTQSIDVLTRTILSSSLVFVGFIMLTEPLTTPPTKHEQIVYGILVGLLFAPRIHIGSFYFTPETALVFGNIFSYLVSPKKRLVLNLKEKIKLSDEIYDFSFVPDSKLNFKAGQYLEWTLPHKNSDDRGLRRYLTIASSPSEEIMTFGIKIPKNPSSFKKKLLELQEGEKIYAGQLSGDFTLPKNKSEKLVFIAGGIGITPFRSILKHLINTNETRDIILFYTCSEADSFVYLDIFNQAKEKLGIKTVLVLTHKENLPQDWNGETGHLTAEIIQKHANDFDKRKYYISGPHSMVDSYKSLLRKMKIPGKNIITDYFPGY